MVNRSAPGPEQFKRDMYTPPTERARETPSPANDEVQIIDRSTTPKALERERTARQQQDQARAEQVRKNLKEAFKQAGGDVNEEAIVPLKSASKRESDNAGVFDREAMLRAAQEEDDDED